MELTNRLRVGWGGLTTVTVVFLFCQQCHVTESELYLKNGKFDEELFDHESPHNLTILEKSYTYIFISWEAPERNITDIINFEVRQSLFDDKSVLPPPDEVRRDVPRDTNTCYLKGLKSGTIYSFYVIANYSNGLLKNSVTKNTMTLGYGQNRPCLCDTWGTDSSQCDHQTGQCTCRTKYITGRRCDSCHARYYRHEHLGCQKCSCPPKVSNGTCRVEENGIIFCNCHEGHAGVDCRVCEKGLYMVKGKCTPCKCNRNENISAPKICELSTGVCQACSYNTTGDHCEFCLPGYQGDALTRNCTLTAVGMMSSQAVKIIAVCFSVILIAMIVLVVFSILRWRRPHKKNFSFWSVQLRDDHENVNFSALHEQREAHTIDATLLNNDEVEFASKQKPTLAFGSGRMEKL